MKEPVRRIPTAGKDGRAFTVIEYASFRWERDATGERYRVRNTATYFETACGHRAILGSDRWSYLVPSLGLTLYTLLEADTGESSAIATVEQSR